MARRQPAKRGGTPPADQTSADRTARRLIGRITAAEANVAIAVEDAQERGALGDQLSRAVIQWKGEAVRVRREVMTASRLTGDAHRAALKQLRRRVSAIEEVARRIVENAFTERLAPDDQLREVSESLDSLEWAYDELDRIDSPTVMRRVRFRLTSLRPGRSDRGS